jgi:hypothetical protein
MMNRALESYSPIFCPTKIKDLVTFEPFISIFKDVPFWASAGVYFGFPICCIQRFCQGHGSSIYNKFPDHKMIGTGYVPCPLCLDISNHKDFIKLIQKHRHCKFAFPDEGDDNEGCDRFFIELSKKIYDDYEKEFMDYPHLGYLFRDFSNKNVKFPKYIMKSSKIALDVSYLFFKYNLKNSSDFSACFFDKQKNDFIFDYLNRTFRKEFLKTVNNNYWVSDVKCEQAFERFLSKIDKNHYHISVEAL